MSMRTWVKGFSVALLTAALAAGEAANTLTLHNEAYVNGPKITLGDIAEIQGVHAVQLSTIELGAAPLPGGSRFFNAALVSSRIRSAGIDAAAVEIGGAGQVRAIAVGNELDQGFVEESLLAYLAENMPWQPGDAEVTISMPEMKVVVPEGPAEIAWETSPQYRYLGQGSFRGAVYVDGRRQKTVMCTANITAYGEVVVAARDIPRGRPIGPFDVETRKAPLDESLTGLLLGPKDVIGLLASRTLFPGDPLTTRNTQMPKVVRRNQFVPVELKAGTLQVRSQARALGDAAVGDTVRCVNEGTKEEFQGVVRGDGVVVVN